ncbi:hypothetical protein ACUODJ_44565 [Escherichia sp. HC-CC]
MLNIIFRIADDQGLLLPEHIIRNI